MAKTEEKILNKNVAAMKRNKVLGAVIMIVLGIVLLVWPGQALALACRIAGAALCIGGIAAVVMFFVTKDKGFVVTTAMIAGVVVACLGFWIFLRPEVLAQLFPTIIGLFVIITGLINISEAITIHRERGTGVTSTFVIALITILLGLLIFFRPSFINNILVRLIGIVLIFDGVSNAWIMSKITGKIREVEQDLKAPDGRAVDENGERVQAKAYAPDERPGAQEARADVEDAEVRPVKKGFFHRDKKKGDVVSETHFADEDADFTETHNYTTTTIKRPAHGAGSGENGTTAQTAAAAADAAADDGTGTGTTAQSTSAADAGSAADAVPTSQEGTAGGFDSAN